MNYSVIIPHKNIPALLERALASIPVRDDVEIIIVDDASDPAVVDFGNFPGTGRPDTRVVFRDGSDGRRGPGAARNDGLALATGRWLVFVDADDLFTPEAGALMDKYSDSGADIVFMGNTWVDTETLEPVGGRTHQALHIDAYLRRGDERGLRYRMYAPWGKFTKRSLVEEHGIRFSEAPYAEDMIFAVGSGHFARTIVCDPTPLYCYTRRSGALSSPDNIKRLETLDVKFAEDVRVARFLKAEGVGGRKCGKGRTPSSMIRTWMAIARLDRGRAAELLPTVKEFYPAVRIWGARLATASGRRAKKLKRR